MGGKIIVVPGLAVRRYAEEPCQRLRQAGYEVDLRPALAWRGVPVDLAAYGRELGAALNATGAPVDVLDGLSAGTQAAAVAAATTPLVRRLVLVTPTFDPDRRSTGTAMVAALAAALRGEGFPHLGSPAIYGRGVRAVGHLDAALLPGAPVIILDDRSSWPVVGIGERHVFQPGAQGGLDPEDYLSRPRTPTADDHAPEAEWGAEPAFTAAVGDWCREQGRRVVRLLLFQHGSDSPGIARPEDWARTVVRFGARADFLGLDTDKFPHDIGFLGRYGPALAGLPHASRLWSQLGVDIALRGLATTGLEIREDPT